MDDKCVDAFVGVGSNIDPEKHIPEALDRIQKHARLTGVSTFYRTLPVDRPRQSFFLNGIWRITASVSARDLKFNILRRIESNLGRVRTEDKYAARTIDLDLVLYGRAVIDEPDLKIPDPDIRTRPFIAIPLLELEPELILPDTDESLASVVNRRNWSALEPAVEFTQRLKQALADN